MWRDSNPMRADLTYFWPVSILIGTIILLFLIDFFLGERRKSLYPFIAASGAVGMAMANAHMTNLPSVRFFSNMIVFDGMGHFFNYLFAGALLLAILFSTKSEEVERTDETSYYTLLVALTLGMMLLAVSNHLLMIYLSLELVSVLSYVLTGYVRGSRRSSEAALKYVIYGGVASGIMAYGMSLLYGLTGSMELPVIADYLQTHAVNRSVLFLSVLLMMAGFGYKIAAFPFQMWCPDVYEGAPTPFTAFLSVGPKAAGFAILIRFFLTAMGTRGEAGFIDPKFSGWPELMIILSVATMTLGNLAALVQTNMKRLLAYSSIAHAGYMLMGFAALNDDAVRAILFYLVVYLLMNLGAFLVVIVVANQLRVEDLQGYAGLSRRGGLGAALSIAMAIFLFSLTGIPPFAGFIGKFYLFGAVIRSGLYGLAIIGVLNSVVSLYYYVRVVKLMFFDEALDSRPFPMPVLRHGVALAGLAFLTLYLGLFWNGLANLSARSATLLF
ncbi:MAG: NADH-quinone oxidoreductase subunit N [Deltaproteobacteria bacterium]|nr:NADH-quinone oxidoreductase subunit N [Deltaproteobacteria bacterium]